VAVPRVQAERTTASRGGHVATWALLGVLGLLVAGEVWLRWLSSSTEFRPAPIPGPDVYAEWRLVLLRITEVASAATLLLILWATIVRPLRRTGRIGIDGKIAIGCLLGCITDGVLNMYQYIFAWNAHSVNMGSWSAFIPLHGHGARSRYAEALVWGIPMYMYFCIGVAVAGCAVVTRLRRRYPTISNGSALAIVFALACAFDFVVENAIIRGTQAYAFAKAPASVTLWAGQAYQFPLYEMLAVATLGVIFTGLRLSAMEAADGASYVERGFERFRPRLQTPVRVLACIGFSLVTLIMVYHLPINWLGTNGDTVAPLPSYLLPG
jgi:hypothetical protein